MSRRRGPSSKTTACPKCSAFIPVEARFCPNCGAAAKKSESIPIVFVILLLASSLLLMTSTYVTNKQIDEVKSLSRFAVTPVPQPAVVQPAPSKDLTQSAYAAAKGFIEQQFPSAQRISGLNESPVTKNGDVYQVTLFVDSQDGGAATRNVLQVNLEQDRGNWKLKGIVQ